MDDGWDHRFDFICEALGLPSLHSPALSSTDIHLEVSDMVKGWVSVILLYNAREHDGPHFAAQFFSSFFSFFFRLIMKKEIS